MFAVILLVFFLTIITLCLLERLRKPHNLPPGPAGFPLVGCIPILNQKKAHLQLTEWSKKYGEVISFYMGPYPVIVLADLNSIKEALVKKADIFSGRPTQPMANIESKGYGLILTNGELFKEQRRFALSTLRDFGFGRPILEGKINEESEFLLKDIMSNEGRPFDIQYILNNAVSNVICSMVFGQRFNYEDEQFQQLLDILNYRISRRGSNFLTPLIFLPWLRFLPGIYGEFRKNIKFGNELINFIQKSIDEHKQNFNKNDEPADYIGSFLKAQAEEQGQFFVDAQLVFSVLSLFAAGTETTSTTIRWGIFYMCKYPEIQKKVFEEIKQTVGTDQLPGVADRPQLPYTDATIMEVQRLANLAPLAVAHEATDSTELLGYHIPKGSMVIPLLWAVHKNPEYFPDPEVLKPERFLDENNKIKKVEAFMPFSAGKRICLGESLAKMELFLFFAALMQKFHFRFRPDRPPPDAESFVGITISPKPFDVIATLR